MIDNLVYPGLEKHIVSTSQKTLTIAVLVGLGLGCTKPNPSVCCETEAQCSAIGVSDLRPCDPGLVCSGNRCVAASDAGEDVATNDAAPDALGVHVFDVAFPSEWTFSVEGPISAYFMVINTSSTDLSLSTLELKSIDDDNPTAIVRVTANPIATTIPPGGAGGKLSPLSQEVLVDSGVVSEPRYDTTSDYFTLAVQNAPAGTYDIKVALEIALQGIHIPIPMTIHIIPFTEVRADPMLGVRRLVYR